MDDTAKLIERLQRLLEPAAPVRIAVSGGVDSMTLSILAGRILRDRAQMFHARSPAVPAEATARIAATAEQEGWNLHFVNAGEFEDEAYLRNPYRRCYHCKQHLYSALAAAGPGTLLSGTNTDDLGDFRPGLDAAMEHRVRHPFVECGVDKAGVRRICKALGYTDLAELPASPCLSSRVETGVRIQPAVLNFVDRVETELRTALPARVVRCRVRPDEIVVQMDAAELSLLSPTSVGELTDRIGSLAEPFGLPVAIRFEPYQRGSAFVPDH